MADWITTDASGNFTSPPQSGASVPAGAVTITSAQAVQIRESFAYLYWPAGAQWPLVKPVPAAPPAPVLVPAGDWRDRFTDTEKAAITLAAAHGLVATPPDPTLSIMLDDLSAHGVADLGSARLQAGVRALIAAGLLTTARAAVILAPVGLLP